MVTSKEEEHRFRLVRAMAFNHRKTVSYRLVQAAKAYRQRSSNVLAQVGLHPGQDQVLKALSENDGQTMGSLASALSVQPPTITKMIGRLSAQGLLERRQSESDARSSSVFLTDQGRELMEDLDRRLKQMDKLALKGLDDKDRKRLRKALRRVERNFNDDRIEDPLEIDQKDEDDAASDEN